MREQKNEKARNKESKRMREQKNEKVRNEKVR